MSRLAFLAAVLWAPAALACETWCAGHTHTWAIKCAWSNDNCVACDECSHAPPPSAPAPTCDVYVGPAGDDANEGCDTAAPKLTIGACVAAMAERGGGAGASSCLLFPGTYREASNSSGQLVTDVTGLTIALAPSEVWPAGSDATEATLDGTVDLDGWTEMSDAHGTYYRSTTAYAGAVWQVRAPTLAPSRVAPRTPAAHSPPPSPRLEPPPASPRPLPDLSWLRRRRLARAQSH